MVHTGPERQPRAITGGGRARSLAAPQSLEESDDARARARETPLKDGGPGRHSRRHCREVTPAGAT